MSLTSNFDFCVEMGIAQVRQIFHLAFKNESRYPHNFGPFVRTYSGRQVTITGNVHDDETAASDLSFQDAKHIRFSFPFDLHAETIDAPDPSLSRVNLQARVEIPSLLTHWIEEGEEVLGLSFENVVPADVSIVSLEGVPTINIDNFRNAIHNKYNSIPHVNTDTSGSKLTLYDGARDATLNPPNAATPFEIQASLETSGSDQYLKVTAPIHVSIVLPNSAGAYTSYGRIIFYRRVIQTDETITVEMGSEPASASLKTKVELDNVTGQKDAELAVIRQQVHSKYDLVTHTYNYLGNTLVLYDDNRDPALTPDNLATPYDIEVNFQETGGVEYLKFRMPIYIIVPLAVYTSYGRIICWRQVTRDTVANTLSVNMASNPAPTELQTGVELDTPSFAQATIISSLTPLVNTALGGFGTVSGSSFGAAIVQLTAMAINAINEFGTITEPAFSEAKARQILQEEIANYIKTKKFPVYTPKSGDPDIVLSTPVGFCLVAVEVLSILMNRRHGTEVDDVAPDNFLGSNQMAMAVGAEKVREFIDLAVTDPEDGAFPDLAKTGEGVYEGEQPVNTPQGDATLKKLTVALADPGDHDESEGHFWVTGSAVVHIDCWPDPTVGFEGPVFLVATRTDEDGECKLKVEGQAGEFDVDQSCCDVLIDLLIPVIGIIMLIVIEVMIDEVGGELAGEIAAGQGRQIQAIPPVVNGIAEIRACLNDVNITLQGLIFPGDMEIRRLGRSFEDLASSDDLPRP